MKSRTIHKYIKRLSEITHYKMSDIAKLLFLLDDNFNELVNVLERVLNNKFNLPQTPKDVVKLKSLENNKIYADFTNFFNSKLPVYVYWGDNPMSKKPIVRGNNVKKLEFKKDVRNNTKESRKKLHEEYYKNYTPKKKEKIPIKKKNKWKQKKKKSFHYTQSKLVCVMNTETFEIIRIRKDEVVSETKKRNWKNWDYVSKTAYKTQQNKYKLKEYYSKPDETGEIPIYPVKSRYDKKTVKVNLAKAFYVPKDEKVEIDGKKIKTDGDGNVVYTDKVKKYQSKGYKKTVYEKKQKGKLLPKEKAGRKINGKIVFIEKVQKYYKLIKKYIKEIPGKVTEVKIPEFTKATKFISSLHILSVHPYNNKKEMYRNITIKRTDRLGNIHKIPKKVPRIIYLFSKSVAPF